MKKEPTGEGTLIGPRPRMSPIARNVLAAIPVMTLLGCASVSVNKLDAEGHLDEKAPEGMRFYMPRPYVAVNEPFVIASSVFLATGEMSPDGSFILLTEVPDSIKSDIAINPTLADPTKSKSMGPIAIDASKVLVSTAPLAGVGGPQGAPAGGTPPTKPNPTPAPADGSAASTPGVVETKVTNDNQAFAVTPLPRFFTIAWLPDWDEEYVIRTKSGLGSANATVNLGQGWSLQGLDAKVDNSALVKPLLDFYSATFGALQKVATAKIEGPLALVTGKPQGASAKTPAAPTAKAEFEAGTRVTIKITRASVVAPGLYKILKPKELAKIKDIPAGADVKHILKPVYPLSDIPFNTYDVIVIEAARATGDSAFTLGQYTEATSKSAANVPATPPTKDSTAPADPLKTAQKKVNDVLAQPQNTTTKGIYYVATLSTDSNTGNVLAALATTNGGRPGKLAELKSDDEVTKLVIDTLAPGIKVDAKNVTVKH